MNPKDRRQRRGYAPRSGRGHQVEARKSAGRMLEKKHGTEPKEYHFSRFSLHSAIPNALGKRMCMTCVRSQGDELLTLTPQLFQKGRCNGSPIGN